MCFCTRFSLSKALSSRFHPFGRPYNDLSTRNATQSTAPSSTVAIVVGAERTMGAFFFNIHSFLLVLTFVGFNRRCDVSQASTLRTASWVEGIPRRHS